MSKALEYLEKAKELISQMTVEEKISQMCHGSAKIERLDIPSYNWWNEALHGVGRSGVATMFPQAIGLAATFDDTLIKKVADVTATEGRAKYIQYQAENDHDIYKGLTYWTPNINIFRDPRWGRGHETYGEDPHLTSRMGVAFIEGLQGPDSDHLKTAACAKHYAVHSGPESERHSFNAECDNYDLWNTYLPAFETAVKEAKVESVMGAYNRFRNQPCCGSPFLLEEILREKWKFKGHVVSDCWAIKDFHEYHLVTKDMVESVALAIKSGCDLNCGNAFAYAHQALQNGLIEETDLDHALERLFVTRMKLAMLGAPEVAEYTNIPYHVVDSPEHRALNLEVTRRSLVLLKNNNTLPLSPKEISTIGVIGPNADSRRALEGNYEGTASQYITPLVGIRSFADQNNMRVLYAEGCHLYKDRKSGLAFADDRISEAITVAKHSDTVILCLGLDADIEGEEGDTGNEFSSGDKKTLALPGRQQHLLEQVIKAAGDKPVIVVLISGSALAVPYADKKASAVLQAFYPGALGGEALADILFGVVSPCGKLPVTFYQSDKDLPDFREYSMENRTYRYFTGTPLYPFGFGLTYSTFELSDLELTPEGGSITVTNTGNIAAGEVVQVYVTAPEQKELRNLAAFAPVFLSPGESKTVPFSFGERTFARYDANGDLQEISGIHTINVGFSQPDQRSVELCGVTPLEGTLTIP